MRNHRTPLVLVALVIGCSSSSATPPGGDAALDVADAPDVGFEDGVDGATGLLVSTDKGPVRGAAKGVGGSFLGIPYAAPPLGARRFKAPSPHDPWTAPVDATLRAKACPQGPDPFTKATVPWDEDCLTLDVWTPDLRPASPLPVMVFVHGGGFVTGSGHATLYDGAALSAAGNVLVVTLNYRLGALGFLAHPSLSAETDANASSGEYGMLDQQAALRWVQANAKAFGGDPANVTLFGESAGAVSVCAHLASPLSKGLFHKAIAESGTCMLLATPLRDPGTPTVEDSAEERGKRFASDVGCAGATDVAKCLREAKVDAVVAATGSEIDLTKPAVSFGPNIDGWTLPSTPHLRLLTGASNDVPLLVGSNGDEGSLFTFSLTIATDADYRAAMTAFATTRATELLAIYPSKDFASPSEAFTHVLGDVLFRCPARSTAAAMSARVAKTWLYVFTHATAFGSSTGLGAFHASELFYVFGNFEGVAATPTETDRAVSKSVMGLWTRFAATGDPNGGVAPTLAAYTPAADPHLEIGATLKAGSRFDAAHCDALAKIGP